ncbi:MAG: hypothetical protein ACREB2_05045 [Pseudolabrys sp.]
MSNVSVIVEAIVAFRKLRRLTPVRSGLVAMASPRLIAVTAIAGRAASTHWKIRNDGGGSCPISEI